MLNKAFIEFIHYSLFVYSLYACIVNACIHINIVFVRAVDAKFCLTEEFVQLVPLKGKTTTADVLQAVQVVMDTIGLKPERLCGMTMDDAPSMVGRKN